jgi:hypothetical protein
MKTNIAGPDFAASADDVIEIPDAKAAPLIAAGYATPVGAPPPAVAIKPDAGEKAALPEPEKKGK